MKLIKITISLTVLLMFGIAQNTMAAQLLEIPGAAEHAAAEQQALENYEAQARANYQAQQYPQRAYYNGYQNGYYDGQNTNYTTPNYTGVRY